MGIPVNKRYATCGIDALDRPLPLAVPKNNDGRKRLVGLFYFLWNGEHGDADRQQVQNISEILRKDPQAGYKPEDPIWGKKPAFYYWGKPLYGYYLSRDRWVMSRHVELFCEAGIM